MLEAPDQQRETDEQLVQSALGGDEEAFLRLYQRYHRYVLRLAFSMTGRSSTAEDMAQEVFLKTYKRLRSFRGDSRFSTWFYRIAVNTCMSYCRRHRAERFIDGGTQVELVDPAERLETGVLRQQLHTEVHRALLSLKPRLRLIVVLKDIDGLSYEEIAERTGCSKGTIASRLNRARGLLARKLERFKDSVW